MEESPNSKYFLGQEQINKIIDRAREKPESTQGYRVRGVEGDSVTLSSSTGGIGKGTGLYTVAQGYSVSGTDGPAKTILNHGGGIGSYTGCYAVDASTGIKKVAGYTQHKSIYAEDGLSPTLAACDYKDPTKVATQAPPLSSVLEDNVDNKYWIGQKHLNEIVEGSGKLLSEDDPGGDKPRAVREVGFSRSSAETGRRIKKPEEPMYTIRTEVPHGVAIKANPRLGLMEIGGVAYNVRRLTPKECFRLQGFPDELFERAAAVNSDTQLYKQAGNAVTATVSYEIGKWIMEMEAENEGKPR